MVSDGDLVWYWLSTESMTVYVGVRSGRVVKAPPIVRGFIGQRLTALIGWMQRQKGFVME